MMKQKKYLILLIIVLTHFVINAQNTYRFSAAMSIPDNVSNKYLKTGIALEYGADIKLYKNLFLSTGLSASFNNKNSTYRYGFDDEPLINIDPTYKEILDEILFGNFTQDADLYLLNTSVELNLKYRFLKEKKLSPYILLGINGNYSFYQNPLFKFKFDNDGFYSSAGLSGELEHKFSIGYSTAIGVNYKFIFFELSYKFLPNMNFGTFEDPIGLFMLKAGIELPFNKKQ